MNIVDRAKQSATKLTAKFQGQSWFAGVSVDPTDDNQVGLFVYCKYRPGIHVIPSVFEDFPVKEIIEVKNCITVGI